MSVPGSDSQSFSEIARSSAVLPTPGRKFWVETKADVNGEGLSYFRRALEAAGWMEADSANDEAVDWVLITRLRSTRFSRFPKRILHYVGSLINHFPGDRALYNKEPFAEALQESQTRLGCDYRAIHPETFSLHTPQGCAAVVELYLSAGPEERQQAAWFTKILDGTFGKGIQVMSLQSLLLRRLRFNPAALAGGGGNGGGGNDAVAEECAAARKRLPRRGLLAQRGVMKPMLLNGRKFDMRVYVLIASAKPHTYVYYHDGVARRSARAYDSESSEAAVHLTNTAVQRADKSMDADDRTWLMDKEFREYVSQHYGEDTYRRVFVDAMKRLMQAATMGTIGTLKSEPGYYLLLGADVIADDALQLKVLEMNTNPSLGFDPAGDKPARRQQLWGMTSEMMRLVYEVRQKTVQGAAAPDGYSPRGMASARGFQLLYTDDPAGPYSFMDDKCFTQDGA